jgi:hypothetical protein
LCLAGIESRVSVGPLRSLVTTPTELP